MRRAIAIAITALALATGCARAPSYLYDLADSPSQINEGSKTAIPANPRGIINAGNGVSDDNSYTGWPFNASNDVAATQNTTNGYPTYVFNGGQVAYFYPGVVKQLYREFVGIEPSVDPSQAASQGPFYFLRALVAGVPWTTLIAQFKGSNYAASYGNVDLMNDINCLYRSIDGHVGDPVTMFNNIGTINGGTTYLQMAQTIDNSDEHQKLNGVYYIRPTVELFRGFLSRMPVNDDEMIYVMKQLIKTGVGHTAMIGQLRGLSEWTTKGGFDAENINALFRTITGDVAPSDQLANWVNLAKQSGTDTRAVNDKGYSPFLQHVAQKLMQQVSGGGN